MIRSAIRARRFPCSASSARRVRRAVTSAYSAATKKAFPATSRRTATTLRKTVTPSHPIIITALGEAGMSTNGAPSEITCLIADDHEVVREGLRLSLSRAPQIRVVGEASDGASAVAIAERRRPNVVIMDVRMPGMDGLEATKVLSERLPQTAVLIFTASGERSLLRRGLEAGAKGYILKEAPHQTLLRAGGEPPPARARDPPAARGRHVQRGRRLTSLHQPGDGEEPRPSHPRQARGGHPHPCRCDRASGIDYRLTPPRSSWQE